MKQIVVLSGKGGTGKTTVVASLAHLMAQESRAVLVDADVDAPNLGIILQPEVRAETPFYGSRLAVVDGSACTGCGRCAEVCRYDAIAARDGVYAVDPTACEGCAACHYQCPADAIRLEERLSGHWYRSDTRFGPLVHAQLRPGEENSGKLVSVVRQEALAMATASGDVDYVLVDGSPGTGCPVIAAVTGADLALMVAEPTLSGRHDLRRVLGVAAHFRVATAVCINKHDVNPALTEEIECECVELGIPVLARIPYDDVVTDAMRRGLAVTELPEGPVGAQMRAVWSGLRALGRRAH